jgi:tripartite motif-containing protein 71
MTQTIAARAELLAALQECAHDRHSYMHWLPKLGPLQMVDQYTRRATSLVGVVSSEPGQLLHSVVGKIGYPHGVAILPNGHVAVTNDNRHHVQLLDENFSFLSRVGDRRKAFEPINFLRGLCTDANGNIVLPDGDSGRVQVFTEENTLVRAFGTLFGHPMDIALTSSRGEFVITDTYNPRVQIYSADGVSLRTFGAYSANNTKISFCRLRGMCTTEDDEIVVCDSDDYFVKVFRLDGTFVRKFGSEGCNHGEFKSLAYVAADAVGNIVVSELGNHRVQIFRADGTFVRAFGSYGSGSGQFNYPRGVAITASGCVVVVDSGNCRVQLWS